MSRMPPLPGRRVLQHYREGRSQRLMTLKAIRESLVSVAGLVGRPVRNQKGAEIGEATDVVAKWGGEDDYPPVTGLVVRVGRREAYVPFDQVDKLDADKHRPPHHGLRRLRPGEVADLLEDLSRNARRELLSVLEPEAAADALEEMEPRELNALLQEAPPEEAASLVARMEPDEAVDALRELEREDRDELLGHMPPATASRLLSLLDYADDTAGGLMTTNLVLVTPDETVAAVRRGLRDAQEHRTDIDAVIVVDEDGRLLDDVTLYELFVAEPDAKMAELIRPPAPVTIHPEATSEEVVNALIENRG